MCEPAPENEEQMLNIHTKKRPSHTRALQPLSLNFTLDAGTDDLQDKEDKVIRISTEIVDKYTTIGKFVFPSLVW